MLTAQRDRLDRLFLADRAWPYTAWRERYLDHPLVGTIARRLIWVVAGHACGYVDGALRTVDDTAVVPAEDAIVTLWHPIGHDVADVVAWREWLERHGVTQPCKQAHREVYVLTPAERDTATYSNRFAAHILRQHQFHALAAVRGWTDKLRMHYDGHEPTSAATRELPRWGLRAEFWVTGICDNWETDLTDSGAFATSCRSNSPMVASAAMLSIVLRIVAACAPVNGPRWPATARRRASSLRSIAACSPTSAASCRGGAWRPPRPAAARPGR